MELNDLLGKALEELTTEELEFKIRELKKLKLVAPQASAKKKSTKDASPKSNRDKQLANALKGLSAEKIEELLSKL